jgi:hypothetical protein
MRINSKMVAGSGARCGLQDQRNLVGRGSQYAIMRRRFPDRVSARDIAIWTALVSALVSPKNRASSSRHPFAMVSQHAFQRLVLLTPIYFALILVLSEPN